MIETKPALEKYQTPKENKRFMVTIPDETLYIAFSRELYHKHGLTPKEALQLIALEYIKNEFARSMIDRVLEGASK